MSVAHPHDARAAIPERLPAAEIRALSRIQPGRALGMIVTEWTIIGAAIALASTASSWFYTFGAVIVVGARQHALTVLSHDASHYRMLRSRVWNDWVANLLLAWPMFISVQGFRHFHGDHHRFLGEPGDGNRRLWSTHDRAGRPTSEWRYPKPPVQLLWKLARRGAGLTGLFWMARGLVGGFMYGVSAVEHVVRVGLLAAVAALLTVHDAWGLFALFWVLPYCTWHAVAQYVRLICEHSAVQSDDPRYAATRTTIPGVLARFFVLPRNIGYHLEHHWYPSVPLYKLPELHARLALLPGFAAHAQCERSLWRSLARCVARR